MSDNDRGRPGKGGPETPAAVVDTIVTDRCDIEERCASGEPCTEVLARLVAADRSYREGYGAAADQLRATAARYAELHHYGTDNDGGGA